jgi:hypothetical protein
VGNESDPAAGWYNSSLGGVPIHTDPVSHPPVGNFDATYGHPGPGAFLAEHALGTPNFAGVPHPQTGSSPLHFLRRRNFVY